MSESEDTGRDFEILTLERGEEQIGKKSGWNNKFIMKINRRTGETWLLRHLNHLPGPDGDPHDHALRWMIVPTYPLAGADATG